jgi:hypothetical protein
MLEWKSRLVISLVVAAALAVALGANHGWVLLNHGW